MLNMTHSMRRHRVAIVATLLLACILGGTGERIDDPNAANSTGTDADNSTVVDAESGGIDGGKER
jgi:hypothetical protein